MNEELNLAQACSQGNSESCQQLYNKYKLWVQTICYRHSDAEYADDIQQECWMQIFKFIKSFRGESKLSTWIYRVCLNKVRMNYRHTMTDKEKPINEGINLYDIPINDFEYKMIAKLYRQEKVEQLKSYIKKLPQHQQRVINLRLENMEIKDISNLLGIGISTVKSSSHRGIIKLKRIINASV